MGGDLRRLQEEFREGLAAEFYPFLAATKRGIIPERRLPPGATLKLRPMEEPQRELRHKAG